MVRVAYYIRTSTGRQDGDAQREALRRRIDHEHGQGQFDQAPAYLDLGLSGKNAKRPGLQRLRQDAAKGKLDVVYTYSWSRFARSVQDFTTLIADLDAARVRYVSITEATDTSTPAGRLLQHILAAVAQFQRDVIVENVQCGLAASRLRGKVLGRPRRTISDEVARMALAMRDRGNHWLHISEVVGIPITTIRRAVLDEMSKMDALERAKG